MVNVGDPIELHPINYGFDIVYNYCYFSEDDEYYSLTDTSGNNIQANKTYWLVVCTKPDSILDVPEVRPGYFCSKRKQTTNEHGG